MVFNSTCYSFFENRKPKVNLLQNTVMAFIEANSFRRRSIEGTLYLTMTIS